MNLPQLLTKTFADVGELTRASYEQTWARFEAASGIATLAQLAKLTPEEYQKAINALAKKFKPGTVKLALIISRKVWRVGMTEGVLPATDPTLGAKSPPIGNNVPEWNVLYHGELKKLAATDDLKVGTLERAVILCLAFQGLRATELCKANWGDLNKDVDGRWELRLVGKFKKFAMVGMQPLVMEAIEAWARREGGADPLTLVDTSTITNDSPLIADAQGKRLDRFACTRMIARLTKKHLGHRATAHGLRATFVSDVISRKGIEIARQLARHNNLKTTSRYSRWNTQRDDDREL